MSTQLASLLVRSAQVTGSGVVTVFGVEAAFTRDAACCTVFAMTLGVVLGCTLFYAGPRAVTFPSRSGKAG